VIDGMAAPSTSDLRHGRAELSRDGVLVLATSNPGKYRIDRAAAAGPAKALRPVG
jgi:hypothetical protein